MTGRAAALQPARPRQTPGQAALKYAEFVAQGRGVKLWDEHLKQQIYLGGDVFIARMQQHAGQYATGSGPQPGTRRNVSKVHQSAPPLDSDVRTYSERKTENKAARNQNIADAFYQGGHSQTAIALAFGVSSSTVSRVVMGYENGK